MVIRIIFRFILGKITFVEVIRIYTMYNNSTRITWSGVETQYANFLVLLVHLYI